MATPCCFHCSKSFLPGFFLFHSCMTACQERKKNLDSRKLDTLNIVYLSLKKWETWCILNLLMLLFRQHRAYLSRVHSFVDSSIF